MTKRERDRLHRQIKEAGEALETCASALATTGWEGYRKSMRHWNRRLSQLRQELAAGTSLPEPQLTPISEFMRDVAPALAPNPLAGRASG